MSRRPSHHLMAIWCSLGSRLRPRPGDGMTESQADAWGEDRQKTSIVSSRGRELSSGEERVRC